MKLKLMDNKFVDINDIKDDIEIAAYELIKQLGDFANVAFRFLDLTHLKDECSNSFQLLQQNILNLCAVKNINGKDYIDRVLTYLIMPVSVYYADNNIKWQYALNWFIKSSSNGYPIITAEDNPNVLKRQCLLKAGIKDKTMLKIYLDMIKCL